MIYSKKAFNRKASIGSVASILCKLNQEKPSYVPRLFTKNVLYATEENQNVLCAMPVAKGHSDLLLQI